MFFGGGGHHLGVHSHSLHSHEEEEPCCFFKKGPRWLLELLKLKYCVTLRVCFSCIQKYILFKSMCVACMTDLHRLSALCFAFLIIFFKH